jgi:nucleoside-triphosphatase THEP1
MLPARDKGLTRLTPQSIILWAGPKHSGKTTSAERLVQAARDRGFLVAGCLAPSVYVDGVLLGFDLVHLRNGARAPLARRHIEPAQDQSFHFLSDGQNLGEEALGPRATKDADLIIIDEYGPWELRSQLWRRATDRLMTSTDAVVLLVVRDELVGEVLRVYAGPGTRKLPALAPGSADEVLLLLERRRLSSSQPPKAD